MAEVARRGRLDTALLVLATTFGSLPIALLTSAALARFQPLSPDARFATGFGLAIPLWVSVMCVTALARSGARALLVCAAISAALAGLVFGVAV
jgi:hypothetical protein